MSQANYIIICSGRGRVAAAETIEESLTATMDCAAQLVSFVELSYKKLDTVATALVEQISRTQHQIMDLLQGGVEGNETRADELIRNMFDFFDQLETALKST